MSGMTSIPTRCNTTSEPQSRRPGCVLKDSVVSCKPMVLGLRPAVQRSCARRDGGGVLAHARRRFYEAQSSDLMRSTVMLAYIRLLYDVEREART